jgi:hypothetical protein
MEAEEHFWMNLAIGDRPLQGAQAIVFEGPAGIRNAVFFRSMRRLSKLRSFFALPLTQVTRQLD